MAPESEGASRRSVLLAGLGGAAIGAVGSGAVVGAFCSVRADPSPGDEAPNADAPAEGLDALEPVAPHGRWQAGIERPGTPQPQSLFLVFTEIDAAGAWLHELGEEITALCVAGDGLLDGPGDLSVTVGLGPDLVSSVFPAAVGAEALPEFAGDAALDADHRGGDLCLQLCGSDPVAIEFAAERLRAVVPGRVSFRQRAYRPPGDGTVVRTPLGFRDGIAIPRSEEELEESVFIAAGAFAGASIWVIRQFEIDVRGFRALSRDDREAAIGRREEDGAPLSGGGPMDNVALGEKSAAGEYLVPANAHARRAHPSFTDSGLMLRRSYSYDNGGADSGLMFVSFQRELHTFVATQRRLDEADAMLEFATPKATFGFLALPGFDEERPLGAMFTA